MVSSGIYRYVASRDELLTRLIVEAYDALGAVAEDAAPRGGAPTAGAALGGHGRGHPRVGAGAPPRVRPALRHAGARLRRPGRHDRAGVTGDDGPDRDRRGRPARRAARWRPPVDPVPAAVRADIARLREESGIDLPADVFVRVVAAWTQLFGLVTFELFGQTRKAITAHDELFDATTSAMAAFIGLE